MFEMFNQHFHKTQLKLLFIFYVFRGIVKELEND